MKFSLINVYSENNGLVSGTWLQDHTGDINTAIKAAKDTEKANSNRIIVAVVEQLSYIPDYSIKHDLVRLG